MSTKKARSSPRNRIRSSERGNTLFAPVKDSNLLQTLASSQKSTVQTGDAYKELKEFEAMIEGEQYDEFFSEHAGDIACIKELFRGVDYCHAWIHTEVAEKKLIWAYIRSYYNLNKQLEELGRASKCSRTYAFSAYVMAAKELFSECKDVRLDVEMTYQLGNDKHVLEEDHKTSTFGVLEVSDDEEKQWNKALNYSKAPLDKSCELTISVYDDKENKFLGRVQVAGHVLKSFTMDFKNKTPSYWVPLTARKNSDGTEEPDARELGFLHLVFCAPDDNLEELKKKYKSITNPPDEVPRMFRSGFGKEGFSLASASPMSRFQSLDLSSDSKVDPSIDKAKKDKEAKEEKLNKDAQMTDEEKEAVKERRARVRQELIDTEKNYVAALSLVTDHFILPLRTKAQEKDLNIPPATVQALVSNWETLTSLHLTLIEDIQKEDASIGDIMVKFGDTFKLYGVYLDGYTKILEALNKLQTHKKFQAFLVKVMKGMTQATGSEMALTSYLIQPVQRVPRYVMLLQEIRKRTFAADAEYDKLTAALLKTSAAAAHINESKRNMENMTKLLQICESISGLPKDFQLIIPHRKFIRQTAMQQIQTKRLLSMKSSNRQVFLFSDIMLLTGQSSSAYKGHVNLSAVTVSNGVGPMTFEVTTAKEHLILKCETQEERAEWVESLTASIDELKASRQKKRAVRSRQLHNRVGNATLKRGQRAGASIHELVMVESPK